jgi:hypothetical protein
MKYNLGRNLILSLFFAALPGLVLANAHCVGEFDSILPCQEREKEKVPLQSKIYQEYTATDLYYSGSILHNEILLNEIDPPQEPPSPTGFGAFNDLDLETETVAAEDIDVKDLYSEIGAKFKSLKKVQKKDIQKCLRYGSYTAKVDGLWGNQTFEAIIDFKNEIEIGNENQRDSVISKIKGVFSNKETCYKFINEIFEL